MTGDHGNSFTQQNSKDVPQFAPNFTVYVLPPDVVCLYSEDRKFFLHGELYCALASAIGKGGRTVRELVRELEQDFPSDRIHEALKRLFDRRYVLPASRSSSGAVAAYWASLGLSPETAERNLQKCRVRIQSIDVQGATELGAALGGLGVRVVKRSPDPDGHAGERLSRRTPGRIEPAAFVGPYALAARPTLRHFSPGGASVHPRQQRLLDLSCRSHETEPGESRRSSTADRPAASPFRPLARHTVGQSAIQLAAVEIAKAIATDFRTELRDHIISLDLLGSTIVKHYVAARPQCPSCGRKKLRDPSRAPMPVELGAGGKLVMTSGGYRTVSPRATVARFRKHVSPLTGVVSRLERIEADLPLNTNYYAAHNFSAPAKTVNELRAGLSGGSFGKGSTAEQGEASALMEAIERYSGIFQGDEIRVTRRFTDFPSGDAIPPNDVLLFSDAQYDRTSVRRPSRTMCRRHRSSSIDRPRSNGRRSGLCATNASNIFRPASCIFSTGAPARSTRIPTAVRPATRSRKQSSRASSNWWNGMHTQSGGTIDCSGRKWTSASSTIPTSAICKPSLPKPDAGFGCSTSPAISGFRRFVAILHWMQNWQENIEFGSGAHFDARIALLRALTELNQFLSIGLMGGGTGEKSSLDGIHSIAPAGPSLFDAKRQSSGPTGSSARSSAVSTRASRSTAACVSPSERASTSSSSIRRAPTSSVPVVRVIVPGMRHFYRRFAPGRLYDVPVKLGLRDRPLPENELNPLHPHT